MADLSELLKRKVSQRSFMIALEDLRRFDTVSVEETGTQRVTGRIGANGSFIRSLRNEDDISVDGRSVWALPLRVDLQFLDEQAYRSTRGVGYVRFWEAIQLDIGYNAPDHLTLDVVLPEAFAARFQANSSSPTLIIRAAGFTSAELGAMPGLGKFEWDTKKSPSLGILECVVADREPAAEQKDQGDTESRSTTLLASIDSRLNASAHGLKQLQKLASWILGTLVTLLIAYILSPRK